MQQLVLNLPTTKEDIHGKHSKEEQCNTSKDEIRREQASDMVASRHR